jgi:hypothetical protein
MKKPHIRGFFSKSNQCFVWVCNNKSGTGIGYSPVEAYENWSKRVGQA